MAKEVGCFQKFKQKLKPQQSSIAGGSLLLLSSGIHVGYGFFHWEEVSAAWTEKIPPKLIALAVVSWFVGSIVGLLSATRFTNRKLVYFIANGLVAFSAVLMIAIPQFHYTVFTARFIAGLAHGLAYVILIQHYGEVVADNDRGRLGTAIHLFLLKGGIISSKIVITFFSVEGRMDANRFLGICSLVLSSIATLMTIGFYTESPARLIQTGNERRALRNYMYLRKAEDESQEISENFKKLKEEVGEDKYASPKVFSKENAHGLIAVLLLRVAFVLTFNFALNFLHHKLSKASKPWIDYSFILVFLHTWCVVATMFTIDKGRRIHLLISTVGTAIVLTSFGCLRAAGLADGALVIFLLFLSFEVFAAVGIGLTAHIYSAEAFSTLQKPGSIAFTACLEHGLQIILILLTEHFYSNLFDEALLITSGVIVGLIAVYVYFKLPETKNISIYEARKKFL